MTTRLLSYRIQEAEEPAIVLTMTMMTSPLLTNSPPMTNSISLPTTNLPPTVH
ncbi:39281_t:CDS:1, partial [Gigaspora margarita]